MIIDMESMQAAARSASKTFGEMGESIMKDQILSAHLADEVYDISYIGVPLYKAIVRFVYHILDDNGELSGVEPTEYIREKYVLAENMVVGLQMAIKDAEATVESEHPDYRVMFYVMGIQQVANSVVLSDKVANSVVWPDES